jgi:hypothetical protein
MYSLCHIILAFKISDVKDIISIIQGLVIIWATFFTTRWTYKTFAHKEKIDELKELKKTVMLYHHRLQLFCMQIRENETPDDDEIKEKLELANIHNKLVALYSLNLYTKPDFRERIQNIVGKWIANDRINTMQRRGKSWRTTEEERIKIWKKFDEEYKEVFELIDKEAGRYI